MRALHGTGPDGGTGLAEDERDDAEAPADEPSEPPEPTKPGRWVKREGRWVRVSEDDARLYDEGTRHYELPSGEVVREPMTEEELGPAPGEAEDEGRFGGLFGRKGEGEPPEGEEGRAEDEPRRGRGILVAVVVIILILLIVGLVAAAVLDIADPLGLGDALGTDDGGDGTNGDGPPPPPPEPDEFRFPVTWATDNLTEERTGDRLSEGDTANVSIPITQSNVTSVRIVLTWDDSEGGATVGNDPDTFSVTVLGPTGINETQEATNDPDTNQGEIVFEFTFATAPTSPTEIVAESRANATRDLLEQQPPSLLGIGVWNITIEVDAEVCSRQDSTNVGTDCGNAWDLDFTWSWYEATLGEGVLIEDDDST